MEGAAPAGPGDRRRALAPVLQRPDHLHPAAQGPVRAADRAARDGRETKEKLVAEAEALASSTDWGPTTGAYRDLMTRWKAAGPAPRDVDEALWKRFRAAQDTFFAAKQAALRSRTPNFGSMQRQRKSCSPRLRR